MTQITTELMVGCDNCGALVEMDDYFVVCECGNKIFSVDDDHNEDPMSAEDYEEVREFYLSL